MSDGMVERFNKTLEAMLSAFVNENHTDWDEHLQLIMMAYRSTEHETRGFTPNVCMLGRETSCPLDIMYEMPRAIKQVPINQWVWELQEMLENAHRTVRQNTGEAMKRQKTYHDQGLSFETFDAGEKVYVYFPIKRVGCSAKLTSYWRGPYEVIEKMSDVLYKVNCGRLNNIQVIHCNRMRKCKKQTLLGEQPPEDKKASEVIPEIPEPDFEVSFHKAKRERHKPTWLSDYVLSLSRNSLMPNTKMTERKAKLICPTCKEAKSQEEYQYHLELCIMKLVGCDPCRKTFKSRKSYLQHVRRKHQDKNNDASDKDSEANDNESDWELQSECEVDDSIEEGRTVSKRTSPSPVFAPKRRKTEEEPEDQGKEKKKVEKRDAMTQVTDRPATKFGVMCRVQKENDLTRQSMVINDEVGEFYSSSASFRDDRVRDTEFRLLDILPEGQIHMPSVILKLKADGSVSLDFDLK